MREHESQDAARIKPDFAAKAAERKEQKRYRKERADCRGRVNRAPWALLSTLFSPSVPWVV
jgi:hypothetical protein